MGSLGGCREQGHAPPATDIPQAGEDQPLTPKTGQQSQNAPEPLTAIPKGAGCGPSSPNSKGSHWKFCLD